MVKRCYACMNPIESDVCKKCGHDNSDLTKTNSDLLKPGTIIKDRFYVGLPIDQNGEGVTYIGYDNINNEKVRIREFFPDTLCHRDKKTQNVICNVGYEIQFKSLMTDYVELSRQLISITANNSLLKAREILSDNSTIYTVYEDVEGIRLTKYLRNNAGELSWEETENLFLPLLYTVKLLNSNGIIHRGISPETILVTKNHELKLSGICTSAVRAINSEVTAELFVGYAAPEQYQKCTSHGEWTDVYSISAVLYRTLTGTMPQRADMRSVGDEIIKPRQLNQNITASVSKAITNGLGYSKSNRTLYVKDLIGELYAASSLTQPINTHHEIEQIKKPKKFKLPIWLIAILITLPIVLGLFFLAYNFYLGPNDNPSSTQSTSSTDESSDVSSSEPETESSEETSSIIEKVYMEDFKGQIYDDIVSSEPYISMFKFKEKIEKYDETAEIGEIIDQDIEAGLMVANGTEVQLTVSKGMQFISLPPFYDENTGEAITPEEYKEYLVKYGLEAEIEKIDSETTPSGEIDSLSVEGSSVDREKVKTITIYVAR